MDFVVAGLGFGALLIVIGFGVRDVGPLFWRAPYIPAADELARVRRDRLHLCHGIANALMTGGGIILLATIATVIAGVSDRIGALIVLAAVVIALALAGMLVITAARAFQTAQPVLTPLGRAIARKSSLSSPDGVAPSSVRRIAQPLAQPQPADPAQPAPPDPEVAAAEIAAFDPNKLFPSEFDDEGDDDDPLLPRRTIAAEADSIVEATAVGEIAPAPEVIDGGDAPVAEEMTAPDDLTDDRAEPAPAPPLSVDTARLVESEGGKDEVLSVTVRPPMPIPIRAEVVPPPATSEVSVTASEPAVETTSPASTPDSAEPGVAPVFQSRLLADIVPGSVVTNGSGFASEVLAGVAEHEPAAVTFQSPLLADLRPPVHHDRDDDRNSGEHPTIAVQKRRSLFSRRHHRP